MPFSNPALLISAGLLFKLSSSSTLENSDTQTPIANSGNQSRCLSDAPSITVLDVYDMAAAIGKEFEIIVDLYGADVVTTLMPKVIDVLAQLEDFATRIDAENGELLTLQLAVNRLELEKVERTKEKARSEKEIEDLEQTWHSETRELLQLIDRLKQENAQLKEAIHEKRAKKDACISVCQPVGSVEEIQLMLRLKEVIDRQKVELRGLRRQLAQLTVDLDAMQQQAMRLAKLNSVLRRQRCVSKRRADELSVDKCDLVAMLQTKEMLIEQLRRHLHHGLVDSMANTVATCGMSSSMINELASPGTPPAELTESQLIERLNAEDKMLTHRREGRRRFIVQEFRELLTERNELKSRIIEVEEELSVFKRAGDDDPPVQGPIDKEPYEKLHDPYPRSSRIKQFFENILLKLSS